MRFLGISTTIVAAVAFATSVAAQDVESQLPEGFNEDLAKQLAEIDLSSIELDDLNSVLQEIEPIPSLLENEALWDLVNAIDEGLTPEQIEAFNTTLKQLSDTFCADIPEECAAVNADKIPSMP
ncbi:MAG: hypothetical protein AAGB32_05235 [Pseudomonadota bacterium]